MVTRLTMENFEDNSLSIDKQFFFSEQPTTEAIRYIITNDLNMLDISLKEFNCLINEGQVYCDEGFVRLSITHESHRNARTGRVENENIPTPTISGSGSLAAETFQSYNFCDKHSKAWEVMVNK